MAELSIKTVCIVPKPQFNEIISLSTEPTSTSNSSTWTKVWRIAVEPSVESVNLALGLYSPACVKEKLTGSYVVDTQSYIPLPSKSHSYKEGEYKSSMIEIVNSTSADWLLASK